MGITAIVLFAGAAWIAYPSLITLFKNQSIRFNLAAAGATGTATLSWNANTESNLAGYKLYYGTSPRTGTDPKVCSLCGYAAVIDVGKVTTYSLSDLTNGATYYFSIAAYDTSNNESSFSGEVSKAIPANVCTSFTYSAWGACQSNNTQTRTVTSPSPTGCTGGSPVTSQSCTYTSTSDTKPPSVPTKLSAAAVSSSQINLSWAASTDTVGVTGYKIYRGSTQISTTAKTSYSDTGLSPNTSYSYKVSAYDVAGNNSAESKSSSATTYKFSANERVMTNSSVSVRATPSTRGTISGSQNKGVSGSIVGGPINANSYRWWNVNFDKGPDGWVIENKLNQSS